MESLSLVQKVGIGVLCVGAFLLAGFLSSESEDEKKRSSPKIAVRIPTLNLTETKGGSLSSSRRLSVVFQRVFWLWLFHSKRLVP